MKTPVLLVSLFALLTLSLPLAAVGAVLPAVPAAPHPVPAPAAPTAAAPPQLPATPPATPATPTIAVDDVFNILNRTSGKVQRVKRSDYVRGALTAEMPPSFHAQALAAQAVAANTYAVRCRREQQASPDPTLKGADFSADPANWQGYVTEAQARERFGEHFDLYWGKLSQAAELGAAYIVAYEEEPIVAAYHSISGGQTEYAGNVWQGDAPYLLAVESFGDTLAPNYESTAHFSAQEVQQRLLAADSSLRLGREKSGWLQVISRSESGYVLEVMAGGKIFTGKDLRRLFELRSSHFTVAPQGDGFTFAVKGYGHGVGLSQYGADYMARQGATFDEILAHYYSGCTLLPVREQTPRT